MRTTLLATASAAALVAGGAAVALTGGSASAAPTAPTATATAVHKPSACIGTWDAQVGRGPQVPPLKVLLTIHADGTAIVSEAAAQADFVPGGAAVEFNSAGLGVWKATGRDACSVRVKTLSNNEKGLDSGSALIDVKLTVARGGNSLSGAASLRTSLPEGGGSSAAGLPVSGTRITI